MPIGRCVYVRVDLDTIMKEYNQSSSYFRNLTFHSKNWQILSVFFKDSKISPFYVLRKLFDREARYAHIRLSFNLCNINY